MRVTGTSNPDRARLSRQDRLSAIVLGLTFMVPLAVAYHLDPSPQNRGTHQQLGLPPCTVVVVTGHRCPACGMTTAWAHLVRGHWIGAFRANVGGALLGLLTLLAVPWLLISAAWGRWLVWVPDMNVLAWVLTSIMVVTLIDWGLRLILS
jgi:hypothetical protein